MMKLVAMAIQHSMHCTISYRIYRERMRNEARKKRIYIDKRPHENGFLFIGKKAFAVCVCVYGRNTRVRLIAFNVI